MICEGRLNDASRTVERHFHMDGVCTDNSQVRPLAYPSLAFHAPTRQDRSIARLSPVPPLLPVAMYRIFFESSVLYRIHDYPLPSQYSSLPSLTPTAFRQLNQPSIQNLTYRYQVRAHYSFQDYLAVNPAAHTSDSSNTPDSPSLPASLPAPAPPPWNRTTAATSAVARCR